MNAGGADDGDFAEGPNSLLRPVEAAASAVRQSGGGGDRWRRSLSFALWFLLPLLLFLATIASTYAGRGPSYCAALMFILTAHELGHFLQARRYRVPTTLPFFIPMPSLPQFPHPFGTMGAIIGMRAHSGDRRALFDIAITGPIAGLVPALICCVIGIGRSTIVEKAVIGPGERLGAPLVFQWLVAAIRGPLAPGTELVLDPIAYAGWVGLFVTALNLLPIGQLDGGHILYALLRKKAHFVAFAALWGAAAAVAWFGYWAWSLMLLLLFLMGARHPPTADDTAPLGIFRVVLGWLALAFVVIGFTPTPFF